MKDELKDFNKGVRGVRNIRLSFDEKEALKGRLLKNIISESRTAQSKRSFTIFEYFKLHHQFTYGVSAIVLTMLVGGSTAFAAEGALPGDILYPMKIYVNESVRGAVVTNPTATVEWETKKIERRLEEAETLASRGELDEEARTIIEKHFDKSADEFTANLLKVREENDGEQKVAEAEIRFEARISAHSNVLARIEEYSSDDRKGEIANMREKVESRSFRRGEGEQVVVMMAMNATPIDFPNPTVVAESAGDISLKSSVAEDSNPSNQNPKSKFKFDKKEIEKLIKDTEDKLRDIKKVKGPVQGAIFDDSWKKVEEAKEFLKDVKDDDFVVPTNEVRSFDESAFRNNWPSDGDRDKVLRDARRAVEEADISFTQGVRLGDEDKNKKEEKDKNKGKSNWSNYRDRND